MVLGSLETLAMPTTGNIITSIGMCSRSIFFLNEPKYQLSSFVDRDMLMRYHWGLGVGHAYAYNNTELPEEILHNDGPVTDTSTLPEINILNCHVDWDGDDTDSQSLVSSLDSDHSSLDDVDVEIAAMYSQDEGSEEDYEF